MRATVSKRINNGAPQWCVDAQVPGKPRSRKFFDSHAAAKKHAQGLAAEFTQSGATWASIPEDERAEVVFVYQQVRKAGMTMGEVWKIAQRTAQLQRKSKPLGEVVTELVQEKAASGRRGTYVTGLKRSLTTFARGREASPIDQITRSDIQQWVAAKYSNAWSQRSILSHLSTLFGFAVIREYIEKNPVDSIDTPKIDWAPPKILTVEQCESAVRWCEQHSPRLLGWLALALFAGVRPQECDRLTWADVSTETLTINAAASKVRSRRVVKLMPAAIELLAAAKACDVGLSMPHASRRRAVRALRNHLGLKAWPADVLRHTCASYWLAKVRNAAEVAMELGNSPNILYKHYRELVTEADADRFWAIRPQSARSSGPLGAVLPRHIPDVP